MIRKPRKEPISIYHHSFYRNKKKSSKITWFVIVSACICLCSYTFHAYGGEQTFKQPPYDLVHPNHATSGQLFLKHKGGEQNGYDVKPYENAMMLRSAAKIEINGLIANVTIVQSFTNQSESIVNGVYAFPLPDDAAVHYMKINIGDRTIEGKITEKNQAKQLFAQAKRAGRKASLVAQHRPNLFTNNIANIDAHEQITVTLKYIQKVEFKDDKFSLRLPTTYTPRYKPRPANERFFPQIADLPSLFESKPSAQVSGKNMMLSVQLNAGMLLEHVSSPSHQISLDKNSAQTAARSHTISTLPLEPKPLVLKVEAGQIVTDRDFVLTWKPKSTNYPQLSVFSEKVDGQYFSVAMLLPPNRDDVQQPIEPFIRDISFVIDVSGSMQGQSIEQAKASLLYAIETLNETDTFNIIAFNQSIDQLFPNTVLASQTNIERARAFITQLQANGGTEMYKPLQAALTMPTFTHQNEQAIRQILFLTDGAVSNEAALFKLIHNSTRLPRLFTVGIGAAPNGYFMKKAAQFGQGSYTYISKVTEVKEKMSALLNKISQPVLRDISLQFQPLHLGSIEQFPKKIPDLHQGEPLMVAFKTAQMPTSIEIFGEMAEHSWHKEVTISNTIPHQGISTVWARAKIEDLMDSLVTGASPELVKEKVLSTSLLHQVMSPYTSFLAVEQLQDMNNDSKSDKEKHKKPLIARNKQVALSPFPTTAVGWKFKLMLGLFLLFITLIWRHVRGTVNDR